MKTMMTLGVAASLMLSGLAVTNAQTIDLDRLSQANNTTIRIFVDSGSRERGRNDSSTPKIMISKLPASFELNVDNPEARYDNGQSTPPGNDEVGPETTEKHPARHRGDWTFHFGEFPYFSYYEWVPPIANQPRPYGLHYW